MEPLRNGSTGVKPTLRPVTPSDLGTLTAMAVAFHDEDGHPLSKAGRASLQQICEGDPLVRGWMIEQDDQAIGYLVITIGFSIEYGGRDGFIDDLCLIPEARGQGTGAAIMKMAETEAKELNIQALHLEVESENQRAQTVYNKQGFKPSGRLLMSKRLR